MLWFHKLFILKVDISKIFFVCLQRIQMLVWSYYFLTDGVFTFPAETDHFLYDRQKILDTSALDLEKRSRKCPM